MAIMKIKTTITFGINIDFEDPATHASSEVLLFFVSSNKALGDEHLRMLDKMFFDDKRVRYFCPHFLLLPVPHILF